ncbi:MAG: hypothetical protein OH318_01710 [Candidatus Parvarchaeota archaeon]|nr:hypothetical protein [Candidatus Rehaiarchaeum fermentans]
MDNNYSIQPSNQQNLPPSLLVAPAPNTSIPSRNKSNPQNSPNNNSNNAKKNYINKSVTIYVGMVDNITNDSINHIYETLRLKGLLQEFYMAGLPAFTIYGLVNPTIIIKKGVEVTFDAFDLSDYTYHGLMIVNNSLHPPYNAESLISALNGVSNLSKDVIVTGLILPPLIKGNVYEESVNFYANNTGTYWYVCPVPGHAELGIYGKIIVI